MTLDENSSDSVAKFGFLATAALDAGAAQAILIPTSLIVVEDRVGFKCKNGCPSYGRSLTCPPHAPEIERFRRILTEYTYALLVRFRSQVSGDEAVLHSLLKSQYDPMAPAEAKNQAAAFLAGFSGEGKKILNIMLDLERQAFNAGNPFALAMTAGSCRICEKCNVQGGICLYPTRSRFSPEAVGINVVKTAEQAGVTIRFPAPSPPDRVTFLLIS